MIEQLNEQIKIVVGARELARGVNEAKRLAMGEWETQHADLLNSVALLGQQQIGAETRLRELTLQAYNQTGDKAPAKGVSVKIFEVLNYDSGEAKTWAISHGLALKLDVPTFEKVAKAEKLSFVSITTEPRAQIATQLEAMK